MEPTKEHAEKKRGTETPEKPAPPIKYFIDEAPAEAVVVHCGDPRFQKAFRDFIQHELGIANYVPLTLGGGIHSFGAKMLMPKNFKVLWEQIKFFVKEGKIRRVVVINHADCQWYKKLQGMASRLPLETKLRKDLLSAAEVLTEDFLGVRVDKYYANLQGKEIIFEEVK